MVLLTFSFHRNSVHPTVYSSRPSRLSIVVSLPPTYCLFPDIFFVHVHRMRDLLVLSRSRLSDLEIDHITETTQLIDRSLGCDLVVVGIDFEKDVLIPVQTFHLIAVLPSALKLLFSTMVFKHDNCGWRSYSYSTYF